MANWYNEYSDWNNKYQDILRQVIARYGAPVVANESIYRWVDYRALDHIRGWYNKNGGKAIPEIACPVTVTGEVTSTDWDEFESTFYEGDESHTGMQGWGRCECGEVQGNFRLEGNVPKMLALFWDTLTEMKEEEHGRN